MRWLFVFLIALLMTSDFLGHNPGLGPGLSLKNATLYMIALALMFRMALTGNFKLRMPALHMAWGLWVGYAVITWFMATLVIHYYGYDVIQSALGLKSDLIDMGLYCFVVFYGVQDERDYRTVMNALLATVGISSVLTLTDLVGLTGLGMKVGDTGAEMDRVFGAFGHANETADMLGCMIPGLIVTFMSNRGFWRVFWLGCAGATVLVFILTVSRGGYAAVALGYPLAALLVRKYLPPGRIAVWGLGIAGAAIVAAVTASIIDPSVAGAITDRVLGVRSMGISEASSGRTDLWGMALNEMMANPISLLTGFGWNAWSTMPTMFATHNTYLDQWFNLGLLGLFVYVFLEYYTIMTARRAVPQAEPVMRGDMLAYVFGMMAMSVGVTFSNLYTPKPYLWMYIGLVMRGALLIHDAAEATQSPAPVSAPAVRLGVGVSLRKPRAVRQA
jgi:O-antigen ligase